MLTPKTQQTDENSTQHASSIRPMNK